MRILQGKEKKNWFVVVSDNGVIIDKDYLVFDEVKKTYVTSIGEEKRKTFLDSFAFIQDRSEKHGRNSGYENYDVVYDENDIYDQESYISCLDNIFTICSQEYAIGYEEDMKSYIQKYDDSIEALYKEIEQLQKDKSNVSKMIQDAITMVGR